MQLLKSIIYYDYYEQERKCVPVPDMYTMVLMWRSETALGVGCPLPLWVLRTELR